jgi:hypothetical protein
VPLDFTDFDVLTHCLPSRRGDRLTTTDGIASAVPGATEAQVARLFSTHALLPADLGHQFYAALDLWVRHGWYLTSLAHLAVQGAADGSASSPPPAVDARPHPFSAGELIPALLTRETTRAFARKPVPLHALTAILQEAGALVRAMNDPRRPLRLFLAALAVEGLDAGLYEWDFQESTLGDLGKTITRRDLRAMAVGQTWAGAGAAAVIAVRELDLRAPGRYELDLVDLGRLGQRICLAAAAQDLGVFLTPAVDDVRLFDLLPVPKSTDSVAYFFTLGRRKGRIS